MSTLHEHPLAVAIGTGITALFIGVLGGVSSAEPASSAPHSPAVTRTATATTTVTPSTSPTPAPTVTVTEQVTATVTAPAQYSGSGAGDTGGGAADTGGGAGGGSGAGQDTGVGQDTGGGGYAYYKNCSEARAAGAAPLHRWDPGYRSELDRDNDGVACE